MNAWVRLFPAVVVVVVAGLAPACPQANLNEDGKCQSNLDCPEFNFCDPAGTCRCNDNAACDASEFCNLAGSCQQTLECFTDDDCRTADNPAAICDTRRTKVDSAPDDNFLSATGGQCVTLNASTTQCLMDSHCPFGFFCNSGICQPGCRDNADCALGDPCINGTCDPTPGACNENGYCAFGETCVNSFCQPHRQAASLCGSCDNLVCFTQDDCPAGVACVPNDNPLLAGNCAVCGNDADIFCLVDASIPALACTQDSQCTGTGGTCKKRQCLQNTDCETGTCVGASQGGLFDPPTLGLCSAGSCGAEFCGTDACNETTDTCPRGYGCGSIRNVFKACTRGGGECDGEEACSADQGGENNLAGFCSCDDQADCLNGSECVDPGPGGACIAGASCTPQEGLLCGDLR